MRRHTSLHPLSEHHHALVQALEIARAAQAPVAERRARLRQAAESLLHFWEGGGQNHFREEEEVLLPALARHMRLDQDADVMRMLADHAQIRAAIQDIGSALSENRVEDGQIIATGQLLHDHVRLEEDTIFPRIEAALDERELVALKPHLTSLHRKP
jgi:hemerythrin-like domain-containing protein